MRFLKTLRPINLILVAIIQVIIQYNVILPHVPEAVVTFSHVQFALMVAITVVAAAAGYLINDIYDVAIDATNKPGKNAIGSSIPIRTAWIMYFGLTAVGAVLTMLIGQPYALPGLVVYGSATFMLWAYSARFKRTPLTGNIVVSIFGAMVVYVIWLGQSINMPDPMAVQFAHYIVMMYCAFAFLSTLLREIVKDIEDVEGDGLEGARTLPTVSGVDTARRLSLGVNVALIATICYWLSKLMTSLNTFQIGYMALTVIIPLCIIVIMIQRAQSTEQWHRISQYIKGVILLGTLFLILI